MTWNFKDAILAWPKYGVMKTFRKNIQAFINLNDILMVVPTKNILELQQSRQELNPKINAKDQPCSSHKW